VKAKAYLKLETEVRAKSEANSKVPCDVMPKLVERVHALYEELGRRNVLAVQKFEKAQEGSRKEIPHQ
jgi:H+-transporting ATPase